MWIIYYICIVLRIVNFYFYDHEYVHFYFHTNNIVNEFVVTEFVISLLTEREHRQIVLVNSRLYRRGTPPLLVVRGRSNTTTLRIVHTRRNTDLPRRSKTVV